MWGGLAGPPFDVGGIISGVPRVKIDPFSKRLPFAKSLCKPGLNGGLRKAGHIARKLYKWDFSAGYPGVDGLLADVE